MRIKAICIPAPLSFPVPFIYPSAAPPQPNPPSTLTAPFHSSDTKLASMVVVRKKIDKNITSTHFIVTSSLPRPFVLLPSDLKTPQRSLFLCTSSVPYFLFSYPPPHLPHQTKNKTRAPLICSNTLYELLYVLPE